ncbi:MAG: AprI/Inh family metalloprotease inhibitor [Pseudomonadota bacterium]
MAGSFRVAVVVAMALTLAACVGNKKRPAPLPAAQTAPVQTAELPPPTQPEPDPPAPIADEPLPGAGDPEPAATLPPASESVAVGRTDLLGGWAIASGGERCQLFMSLTTWTGGYRASTRGCSGPQLAGISAWDLSGNTVTLKGGDGAAVVATLRAASKQDFNGTTSSGSAITVSR